MKTVNKRLIGLIAISIVQLTFPLFFIVAKEHVIETGKEYLFRIQPVDPYDFFQGRYVNLNVQPLSYETTKSDDFKQNDIVYAEFEQDTAGVKITAISHKKTKHSLKLKLFSKPNNPMYVRLPFKRFYLEETKATTIEKQLATDRKHPNFVHVKILKGDFVITDISSNGKSLITGNSVQSPDLSK
ncbi:GDYXXLXY domain-containing protein [Fluviicola taffensis]|uniref:GDYXXLXY domain-containing protein n=1 Tax=Fluviicola taffensis TaxID=191579 RepID=UPI003138297A